MIRRIWRDLFLLFVFAWAFSSSLALAGERLSEKVAGGEMLPVAAATLPQRDTLPTSEAGKGCSLPPLVMPPTPKKIPGYTELDSATGLHVTGGIQEIDVKTYRLAVTGKVSHPLSLGYDELRCMGTIEARPNLVCPGFFSDVARWAGVPLKTILDKAGLLPGVEGIRLVGADKYIASLPIDAAGKDGYFLAYEWEGKALPRLHGFPLRAVFPDLEGNQWVKWLIAIEAY
jgi:DMSO/TMAO reductase YedYZ molybdopterin-dependent catalytic subunit